jgi:uncharacterized protein involved in exopolysaccharide biosynthesis
MSFIRSAMAVFRALAIAAACAVAAFGVLAVLDPFAPAPAPSAAPGGATAALQGRIAALRLAISDDEAALRRAGVAAADTASRLQIEAQIAAASERRDLTLRQAEAIRAGLRAGTTLSALAAIRDSTMVGQLLSRQAALEAQIATESARLRASHPTMRALLAQRDAVALQIRQEAANIAAALDAEAALDASQIARLEAALPAGTSAAPAADRATREAALAARRAELDRLVDAYFDIPAETAVAPGRAEPFRPLNLGLAGAAGLALLVVQFAFRRARRRPAEHDELAAWAADPDPETAPETAVAPLRRAS